MVTSEHNATPKVCTITGTALPGIVKERLLARVLGQGPYTMAQLEGALGKRGSGSLAGTRKSGEKHSALELKGLNWRPAAASPCSALVLKGLGSAVSPLHPACIGGPALRPAVRACGLLALAGLH